MGIFDIFGKKSIDKAVSAVSENMKQGELYMHKGLKARQNNDYDKALDYFNKSIEIADYIPSVYLNRGAIYQILEQFLDARDDYRRVIQMEQDDPTEYSKENINGAIQNLQVISGWCDYADNNADTIKSNIDNDGIEYAAKRFGEILTENMNNNYNEIYYFILDELREIDDLFDGATMFILKSGIEKSEYLNPNASGIDTAIQNYALNFCKSIYCCLSRDPDLMLRFRISLLDQIMQKYEIGKYS